MKETLEETKMTEELAWDLAKQSFKESEGREPNINDTDATELLIVSCLQEGILKGATWQQEKSFSEENMRLAFETGRNFQLTGEDNFSELINNLKSKL